MIKSYEDYLQFMKNQIIYLKDKPICTLNPKPIEWSRDKLFGAIELHVIINGPVCLDKYFNHRLHILFYLREPYIKPTSWDEGDRGGHNQSTDYGECNYIQINNLTFQNIVKFAYFFVNILNGKMIDEKNFKHHEHEAINLFRDHICILNACWFPHTGSSKAIKSRCNNWLINNDYVFKQLNDLFTPTIIIGAGVLKPQWDFESGKYKMFGLERRGFLTPQEILSLTNNFPIASECDHTFLMSDEKIYINTYHPQVFDPYQTARCIWRLYVQHNHGLLNWHN